MQWACESTPNLSLLINNTMKLRISIFFLTLAALLPLRVLYVFADFFAVVMHYIVGYRHKLVRRNLTDSFPDKDLKEIKDIEKRYYKYICDVMVETVKLLHISDKEMADRVKVLDYELVNRATDENRPAVIMLGHYGNWEWAQEMAVYFTGTRKGSIYHTMASPLWDKIFLKIRSRWHHVLVPQKAAVRYLLDRDNLPWIFGFIADQRPKTASKHGQTMFLNHETSFIIGPEEIGARVNADFFYMDVERPSRGHYVFRFKKLEPVDDGQPYPYSRAFWHEFEQTINRDVPLWLWSHNRWNVKWR